MRLVDYFVPERISLAADLEELRRARLTIVACYSGVLGLGWGVYFHVQSFGMTLLPAIVVPAVGLAAVAPFALRWTGSLSLATNLLIGGSVFSMCAVDLLSGGTSFGAISVAVMLPLFAVMLSGAAWGLIWGSIVLVHFGILSYMDMAGIVPPYLISPDMGFRAVAMNAPIVMIVGLVAGITSDSLRRRAFREADLNWHRSEHLKRRATQSEARYRALSELASDYTIFVTVEGDVPRLVWATDSVAKVTGYTAQELKQLDLRECVHPLDQAYYAGQLSSALEGKDVESEFRIIHKDGSVRWLRSLCRLGQEAEAGVGIYGACRDITAEREQAAVLLQSQKMEVMGQLTGGVAHDFNNLLTVIIGNLELLRESGSIDNAGQSLLGDAMQAAVDGGELVSNLLMFARERLAETAVLDVVDQVRGMRPLLERALGQSTVLAMELPEQELYVLADRSQLQSALLNLCLNARDALGSGGQVRIALEPDTSVPPGSAQIRVTDTGCGMDSAGLSKARQPFFTTKPPGSGSGLGLSMVDGFMEGLGGCLQLQSELGVGTTVILEFPLVDKTTDSDTRARQAPADLPKGDELVLVVDDEVLIRRVARTLLESLGYRVMEAEHAAAAQKILHQEPNIQLLFSDWIMPGGMDGSELAKWANRRWPELSILLTTGYSERARGRTADHFPVLFKPYTRGDLAVQIRQVLDSSKAPRSAAPQGRKKTP